MTALYHSLHRFQVTRADAHMVCEHCSPSENFSWVGKRDTGRRYRIHTFRGVPGKHVDLLFPDDPHRGGEPYRFLSRDGEALREDGAWLSICDIGLKEGRFDGAKRFRLTFRDLAPSLDPAKDPPAGKIVVEEDGDDLRVVAHWKGGIWAMAFPQLRYTIDDRTDFTGVLVRQAQTYYGFLWATEAEQVRALANEWQIMPHVRQMTDINALNRSAAQALYELAGHLGWRKLPLRQRLRLGLDADSPQWQRVEKVEYLRQKAGLGVPQGVGEYTLAASNGERMVLPAGVCTECQEIDCECQE